MNVKTLSVPCPICQTEVIMTSDSPFRPFCSQRCKLIDLGEWASESRKIEGQQVQTSDEVWSDEFPDEP